MGDEESDPTLMEFLGAEMKKESGQFFKVGTNNGGRRLKMLFQVWETPLLPRQVLDKLEIKGFKVRLNLKMV